MVLLKVSPLTETMSEDDIEELRDDLSELDIILPPQTEDLDLDIEMEIDSEGFSELAELLEESQAYADIYIPGDFSDIYELEDERRVGSLDALVQTMEAIATELGIPIPDEDDSEYELDDLDDGDYEDDDDMDVDVAFRSAWEEVYRVAREALETSSNLIIEQP